MREIQIETRRRERVDDVVKLVKGFISDLPFNARCVLALELFKLIKPELDELQRQSREVRP